MSEKSKHRRFRFHLLTLVLMTLAASAMLWANVTLRWGPFGLDYFRYYGFPLAFCTKHCNLLHTDYETKWVFSRFSLFIDFGLSVLTIVLVAFVSEFLIHCREARKT